MPVFLAEPLKFDLILQQLILIAGGLIGQNPVLLLPYRSLQAPLHLGRFVSGIVLAGVCNALSIIVPELLQLLLRVLRLIDAKNDGESHVATVQGTDPAHQRVIQGLILRIGVLLSLDRLMVWRTVGVSRYLPAITTHIVVRCCSNLLLHQTEAAHDVPTCGGLQRSVDAALIVNDPGALICQMLRRLADSGIIVGRTGEHLLESIVHTAAVSIPQGERLTVGVYHAKCLGDVLQVLLRHGHGRAYDALQALVLTEGYGLYLRETLDVEIVPDLSRLGEHLPQFFVGYPQKLLELLFDFPLAHAQLLRTPHLI